MPESCLLYTSMAQCAKEVHGGEIVPQAIEDARKNAERNHIENATFYVGKAEEVLPRLYEEEHILSLIHI